VLNLGAEGMMLVAAVAGFATAVHTGSDTLAFAPAPPPARCWRRCSAAGDLAQHQPVRHRAGAEPVRRRLLGLRRRRLRAGKKLGRARAVRIPLLADIPFVGPALFRQHPMVYLAMALTAAIAWFLYRSARRPGAARGRRVARVGARAGLPGARIRLAAVWPAARCAGWPGAYLSVVYTPLWVEGMVAGRAGSRWR
jgi:general nucleoside transport system permease protein